MEDDICPEIDGIAEIGAHECIVRNEESLVGMGKISNFLNIRHLHHGVCGSFDVDGLHRFIESFFHFFGVRGVHEFEFQSVLFIDETEEADRSAVQVVRGKDRISRFEKFHDHGNSGHAGRIAGTVTAVLKGGYHLLRAFAGRILDPRIVITRRLPQLRMAEGGALKNRYGNAAGRVFPVASMNADCPDVHNVPPMFCH